MNTNQKRIIVYAICFMIGIVSVIGTGERVSATEDIQVIDEGESNGNKDSVATEAENEIQIDDTVENAMDQSVQTQDTALRTDSKMAFVEVQNFAISGGILEAGSNLTIIFTLHNISSSVSAESVVMSMSSPQGDIYPSYGTDNQIYIGTILPDESINVEVPVTVSSKFNEEATYVTCEFEFMSQGTKVNNSSTMALTTDTGRSIAVKNIDISSNAVLNGKSLLSINYTNLSKNNITDAKLIIDGNVAEESKEIPLDTVFSWKNYSKDLNLTFIEKGNQSVKVTLVYTDSNGEVVNEALGDFNVVVKEEDTSSAVHSTSNILLQWIGRGIAAVAIIAAMVISFLHFNKR